MTPMIPLALGLLALLGCGAVNLTDATFLYRKSLNPVAYYTFDDFAVANGNGGVTTIKDQSDGQLFGDLTIRTTNASKTRTEWLHATKGRTGLSANEVELNSSTKLLNLPIAESQNSMTQAMFDAIKNTFTIEIWFAHSAANNFVSGLVSPTSLMSIADYTNASKSAIPECGVELVSVSTTKNGKGVGFIHSKDTRLAQSQASECTKTPVPGGSPTLTTNMQMVTLVWDGTQLYYFGAASLANHVAIPIYLTVINKFQNFNFNDLTGAKLNLAVSAAFNDFTLEFYSLAIYPTALANGSTSGAAVLEDLWSKGLPNVRPHSKPVSRSVSELGGEIELCPDSTDPLLDSKCRDTTNAESGILTDLTRADFTLKISALPLLGTLKVGTKMSSAVDVVVNQTLTGKLFFVPVAGEHSFNVTAALFKGTTWQQKDYTTFSYTVTDPAGATSEAQVVTVAVYPSHNSPEANDVNLTGTTASVYAEKDANKITLVGTVKEIFAWLPANSNNNNYASRAHIKSAEIITFPTNGALYRDENKTDKINATHPTVMASCSPFDADANALCEELVVYYYVRTSDFQNSGGKTDLGTITFTYTVSDEYVCCKTKKDPSAIRFLAFSDLTTTGNITNITTLKTKYGQDTTQYHPNTYAIPYDVDATSTPATVTMVIRNGLAANTGDSTLKQMVPTTRQVVELDAVDYSNPTAAVKLWIVQLPEKGTLYYADGTPVLSENKTECPPMPNITMCVNITNKTVMYDPGMDANGNASAYDFGASFASFVFFASNPTDKSVFSGKAIQNIHVLNTNDLPELTLESASFIDCAEDDDECDPEQLIMVIPTETPGTYKEIAESNLVNISLFDPDPVNDPEPFYQLQIKGTTKDIWIFFPEEVTTEWKTHLSPGSVQIGNLQGDGAREWILIGPRAFIKRCLASVKVRLNTESIHTLLVEVNDIPTQGVPGFNDEYGIKDPYTNAVDWASKSDKLTISIQGTTTAALEGEGNTNALLINIAIWGGAGIAGLLCLGCIVLMCCKLKSKAGGQGGKSKSKKYLQSVEL